MKEEIQKLSKAARNAVSKQKWEIVAESARLILQRDLNCAEGHFLAGLVERVSGRPARAAQAFETALKLDEGRYDAAVELANQYSTARRNGDAAALLGKYEHLLDNSSMYLDLAGTVYTEIGMPEKAWPLYLKANELQPEVDLFQANLAACGVFLGKIEKSKAIYQKLLKRFPEHQRNHYQLARLEKTKNDSHIKEMKEILAKSTATDDKNIFLYYALGKELEDLERWDEAFEYYKRGGDAVCSVAKYDVDADIKLIDKIIETNDSNWLADSTRIDTKTSSNKTPIFIVGLPRTGTTLTERIISSHSEVVSLGETQFLQMVLRRESNIQSVENMNSQMLEALADIEPERIGQGYLDCVRYRLGGEQFFIDKLPFNFLYLGFIAKAWPDAKIVHLVRSPMDACFAMYKQVFTWAYKFSYSLDALGKYYIAYNKLREHWQQVLGDRLIEIDYESLVANVEDETVKLLDRLQLPFEEQCLTFEKNEQPSATASSVQVREKAHSRSVNKWKKFEKQLQPLAEQLHSAGIDIDR